MGRVDGGFEMTCKNGLVLVVLLLFATFAFADSITMASENFNVSLKKGETYYFSFGLYNQGTETTKYVVSVDINGQPVDAFFDYNISSKNFAVEAGGYTDILVTLVPKVDFGSYVVRVIASTAPPPLDEGQTGLQVVLTAERDIVVSFSGEESGKYRDKPFWALSALEQQEIVRAQQEAEGKVVVLPEPVPTEESNQAGEKVAEGLVVDSNFIVLLVIVVAIVVVVITKTRGGQEFGQLP